MSDDPRVCPRCGVRRHGEHLCADLAKRLARQEKAIALIEDVILSHWPALIGSTRTPAEEIVKALAGRDLGT